MPTNRSSTFDRFGRNVIRHSWMNFGINLSVDGSQDGDESTIVK